MVNGFHPWQRVWKVEKLFTTQHRDLIPELIALMPFALYWMHNLLTLDIIKRLSWGCTWRRTRSGRWSWSRVKGQLKIVTGRWFGKPFSNKCYQCDYTPTEARKLRIHLKKNTLGKSQTNATCVIMHQFRQVIWGDIWKDTLGKSRTNATNATMHLLR